MSANNLKRFHDAQAGSYDTAYQEIKNGRKTSHWMWFIFPQIQGLGYSEISKRYAIKDLQEASLYLDDPVLSSRIISICQSLLTHNDLSVSQIFGSPDDMKLKSSMTLFSSVKNANPVFREVLNKYFRGEQDQKTLQLLKD